MSSDGARTAITASAQLVRTEGEPDAEQAAFAAMQPLSERVLQPILAAAGDASRLIISPDAALWIVPWVALDGRLRLEPLYLGDGQPLPQLTAMVTVGLAYLADRPHPFSRHKTTRALVAQGSPSLSLGPEAAEPDLPQTP